MNVQTVLQALIPLAVQTLVLPVVREKLGSDTVPARLVAAATDRVARAIAGMGDGLTLDKLEETGKVIALAVADEALRAVEGKS